MSSRAAPSSATPHESVDAVESLYRGTAGPSGLRAYEPSLRPPEGTVDHSWLFRLDEPAAPDELAVADEPAAFEAAGELVPAPGRRWPWVTLLAVGLGCALVLPVVLLAG